MENKYNYFTKIIQGTRTRNPVIITFTFAILPGAHQTTIYSTLDVQSNHLSSSYFFF